MLTHRYGSPWTTTYTFCQAGRLRPCDECGTTVSNFADLLWYRTRTVSTAKPSFSFVAHETRQGQFNLAAPRSFTRSFSGLPQGETSAAPF